MKSSLEDGGAIGFGRSSNSITFSEGEYPFLDEPQPRRAAAWLGKDLAGRVSIRISMHEAPIAEGPSKSRTSCTARCIATTFPRRGGSIRDALTLDRILGQVLAALEALKAPGKEFPRGRQ